MGTSELEATTSVPIRALYSTAQSCPIGGVGGQKGVRRGSGGGQEGVRRGSGGSRWPKTRTIETCRLGLGAGTR
eukprot:7239625-Pyramimonas_sp.AAC.1